MPMGAGEGYTMLSEEEAIGRACVFFSMHGLRFIHSEAHTQADQPPGTFKLREQALLEDGDWLVFFAALSPLADRIEPNFHVVAVNAATGTCRFGIVM